MKKYFHREKFYMDKAVFQFKFNGVPISFMAVSDVKKIVKSFRQENKKWLTN